MEEQIKGLARQNMGEIGGQILAAAENDKNRFEYYISIFLREMAREAHKLLPHGKADRAFNIYRRLFDATTQEVIIRLEDDAK